MPVQEKQFLAVGIWAEKEGGLVIFLLNYKWSNKKPSRLWSATIPGLLACKVQRGFLSLKSGQTAKSTVSARVQALLSFALFRPAYGH